MATPNGRVPPRTLLELLRDIQVSDMNYISVRVIEKGQKKAIFISCTMKAYINERMKQESAHGYILCWNRLRVMV